MLGRFAPGIRRASGPVPVTADVSQKMKCRCVVILSFVTIAFTGCATQPRLSRDDAIGIAAKEINQRENWPNGGDFSTMLLRDGTGRPSYWRVTAMKIVDPSIQFKTRGDPTWTPYDQARYELGGFTTVTMDMNQKILCYLPGVL
jgi:hypothetical protein